MRCLDEALLLLRRGGSRDGETENRGAQCDVTNELASLHLDNDADAAAANAARRPNRAALGVSGPPGVATGGWRCLADSCSTPGDRAGAAPRGAPAHPRPVAARQRKTCLVPLLAAVLAASPCFSSISRRDRQRRSTLPEFGPEPEVIYRQLPGKQALRRLTRAAWYPTMQCGW